MPAARTQTRGQHQCFSIFTIVLVITLEAEDESTPITAADMQTS